MKKSVITSDFEKKDTIVTQTESVRQAKKNRKVSFDTFTLFTVVIVPWKVELLGSTYWEKGYGMIICK